MNKMMQSGVDGEQSMLLCSGREDWMMVEGKQGEEKVSMELR